MGMRGKRRRSTRWAIPHPSRSARSTPVPRRVCALTCCGSPPGGDRRGLPRKRYCRRTRQPTYSSHAAVFLDCVRLPDRAGDSGRARCCSCGGGEPRGGDHRTARAASPLQWLRLCCQPIKWCPCRTSVFRGMLQGSPVWSGRAACLAARSTPDAYASGGAPIRARADNSPSRRRPQCVRRGSRGHRNVGRTVTMRLHTTG